ncbi:PIN domain-containing protein [Schlesneria sp.]|uniref:PIN domain-containing protein n=1 Tax=Schlesneria sp. TaxID=2762018 RepID=UPI002F0558B3
MGWRFEQPDNELGFEQLCLRLYRKVWSNEGLQLYAKRGETQDGVDICDPFCLRPIRAVQCKHHEPSKNIRPSEIRAEVAKAEKSHFPIERYVIATTAKKSGSAQDTVVALNQRSDRKFLVEIHFWEELCQFASEFGLARAQMIMYGETIVAVSDAINQTRATQLVTNCPNQELDSDEPYRTIEQLINDRKLEVARHELGKLPSIETACSLSSDVRYKLLRLHALFHLESAEFDLASALFLQAYAVSPDLNQAKQNQVLGYILANNLQRAYENAARYIAEGLTTPVMVLRLIDSTSVPSQIEQHRHIFASFIDTDESINLSLALKYLSFGEYEKSYAAAIKSLSLSSDSPHAQLAAAMSRHSGAVHGDITRRTEGLNIALEHYAAAESLAVSQRYTHLLPEIFSNRASVRTLLRDTKGAEADHRDAIKYAANKSFWVARAVGFYLHEESYSSARELLNFLDRTTQEGQFLFLLTETHFGDSELKRAHIDEMLLLAAETWDRAVECRFHSIQWAMDLRQFDLAVSLVPEAFQKSHPFHAHTMLAWIRWTEQDQVAAMDEAAKALNASIQTAQPQELRLLAMILVKLNDHANALPLFEQLTTPGVLDENMEQLISCAQQLERHDLLLRLCRELRESGVADDRLRKLEVQLLSHYAPRDALELAETFITQSSSSGYFVAVRNSLAVRLRQFDKVVLDSASLPEPRDISSPELPDVLLPFVAMGKFDQALQFLYRHRRSNCDDEQSQGSYCVFFLKYGDRTSLQAPPSTVQVDCAVLLEFDDHDTYWITVENEQPAPSKGEFALSSGIVQSIAGRQVGEAVELPTTFVRPEKATIREIQTKYVRAFQDTFQNFQRRFPETSLLQKVHVGDAEKFDPSTIVESLKERRGHVENCIQIYCSQPCSLFIFAQSVGATELDAIKALVSYPDRRVYCCNTTPQAFESSAAEGIHSDTIVLSISAIITISMLDGWKSLDPNKHYLISQLTSELLDSWIHESSTGALKESGVLVLGEDNQLVFLEKSLEQREQLCEELRTIRQEVDCRCMLASSMAPAELLPEKRKLYSDVVGRHNLEAAGVAKSHNAALWTDDVTVGFVGSVFGVTSIWSQLAFRCFANTDAISRNEFNIVTAKLAAWNYTNVIWSAETIIAAGSYTDWNVSEWPFRDSIALISQFSGGFLHKAHSVIDFLRCLRRSSCNEFKQGIVIHTLLQDLGNIELVEMISRHAYSIFGVDLPTASFVRQEFTRWLSGKFRFMD